MPTDHESGWRNKFETMQSDEAQSSFFLSTDELDVSIAHILKQHEYASFRLLVHELNTGGSFREYGKLGEHTVFPRLYIAFQFETRTGNKITDEIFENSWGCVF